MHSKKTTANNYINLSEIITEYNNLSKREIECGKKILKKLGLDEEENENLEISCTTVELSHLIVEIMRSY
jgi:hypothetical protein